MFAARKGDPPPPSTLPRCYVPVIMALDNAFLAKPSSAFFHLKKYTVQTSALSSFAHSSILVWPIARQVPNSYNKQLRLDFSSKSNNVTLKFYTQYIKGRKRFDCIMDQTNRKPYI